MKLLRATLLLSFLAVICSLTIVEAVGWTPVTLGRYKETYTSNAYKKTQTSPQYIRCYSAVDSVTGATDRAVEVRLLNYSLADLVVSNWTEVIVNGTKEIPQHTEDNHQPEFDYKMQLRAKRSTFAKVDFYGYWFLNKDGMK